jgi:tRNA-2-methylthio-N6-dimethylallyladenosine synthase
MKKYSITTYGCQGNVSDSERIAATLENIGYIKNEENPDIAIVNFCSIRQSAVDKSLSKLKKLKSSKVKTIATGCILERDRKIISKNSDLILDINDLPKWPKIIQNKKVLKSKNYFSINPKRDSFFSALILAMTGCNNFCTYCAVPYTKGREYYRPAKNLLKECSDAINDGFKELWILGQNVNSYKDNEIDFSDLISMVDKIKGDFWIRFLSSHPKDFNQKLIDTIKNSKKITEYINLPVQSGDGEILKKMNRPYTISEYKKTAIKIRKEIPGAFLSTDIIVGFPGETNKNFKKTVDLFSLLKFDMAYISKYSPRPGTQSYKIKETVSFLEKKKRKDFLEKRLRKIITEKNLKLEGSFLDVLVERKDNKGFLYGKTRNYKTVKFLGPEKIIGNFVKIKIEKGLTWGLKGKY